MAGEKTYTSRCLEHVRYLAETIGPRGSATAPTRVAQRRATGTSATDSANANRNGQAAAVATSWRWDKAGYCTANG